MRMVQIMLCGAADVRHYWVPFSQTVRAIGGEPRYFRHGGLDFLNIAGASFTANSETSVDAADLCVFVINGEYGTITWDVELERVVSAGKPFLLLALEETLGDYEAIQRRVGDLDSTRNPEERKLFAAIRKAKDSQYTILPFLPHSFPDVLRSGLATMLRAGIKAIERSAKAVAAQQRALYERDEAVRQLDDLAVRHHDIARALASARVDVDQSATTVARLEGDRQQLAARLQEATVANTRNEEQLGRRRALPAKLILAATLAGVLIGGIAGWSVNDLIAGSRADQQGQPIPTPSASGPDLSPASPGAPQDDGPHAQLSPRRCGSYIVQLASIGGGTPSQREARAAILAEDISQRLKHIQMQRTVFASLGSDYCESDPDRQANIFLWVGYFSSKDEAWRICNGMIKRGVGAGCFPRS